MTIYDSPNNKSRIKNGALVYIRRANSSGNPKLTPYIIDGIFDLYEKFSLESNRGQYAFYIIDPETNCRVCDSNGTPKTYVINAIRNNLVFPPLETHKLCPTCQNDFILESNPVCAYCENLKKEEVLIAEQEARRKKAERRREEKLRRKEEEQRILAAIRRVRNEKKKFFESRVKINGTPFILDDEQADAVLSDRHAIVTARAGSGKTRVLTAKLIDLLVNCGIRDDEVLAFCFNTDAAEEIRRRLSSDCTVDGQPFARDTDIVHTFHAYAKAVLGDKCGRFLVDDKEKIRSQFVKKIINDLRQNNPSFEKELRRYFLGDTLKVDRNKFVSIEHYYQFVRNSRYQTLKGDYVRSIPEKIIADFLFEHGIKYKYERHFYLNKVDREHHGLSSEEFAEYSKLPNGKGETVPDFHLEDYDIIWEHWGITGKETPLEKINFTKEVGDYDAYKRTMEWKKAFWNIWCRRLTTKQRHRFDFKSVKKLIETNPTFFENGSREDFENRLKVLLESNGVKCIKRSEDEIMRDVWKHARDNFTKQICQFIDKYQQKFLESNDDFIIKANLIDDGREKAFLRLGYLVYKEYVNILANGSPDYTEFKEYKLDFNQCLNFAAKIIYSGEYDHSILQLKWILIDEYQDFSELFYNLIKAILSRNPQINLFCVGDDWQAINRFAGSDLKFFLDFKIYFPNSIAFNIGTNYRCENHIVYNAGQFMARAEIKGTPQRGFLKDTGTFVEIPIDDVKFEDDIGEYEWLVSEGGPWEQSDRIDRLTVQAYIKKCSSIINANPGKKIMILNRKSNFLGKELDEIERILKHPKLCKVKSPEIHVKTVHRSKGEEADIVILTEVDENSFPIYHPDSNLFNIFGENEFTIMEDEARLYYVALTRAKHSIFILYSKDAPSCFIKNPAKKSTHKANIKIIL